MAERTGDAHTPTETSKHHGLELSRAAEIIRDILLEVYQVRLYKFMHAF